MWKSSDSNIPQSDRSDSVHPPTPPLTEIPSTPGNVPTSSRPHQASMIGKSIVIRGEIAASDPLFIYGRVEGSINAPAHRVTIGNEGIVKADIKAREIVVMGDVCGNLNCSDRVEIRRNGSLMGDLAATRIYIEDGAFLKGTIDVCRPVETDEAEIQEGPYSALEEEATPSAEPEALNSLVSSF
jgi:cytoskeletal protein CcmA (bactofilin family)